MTKIKRLLAKHIELAGENATKKFTLELYSAVVSSTPIDTGRARAGWSVDITHGGYKPPKGLKSYSLKQPRINRVKNELLLYNNVEYVSALNEGSSRQAPKHFIEGAILRVLRGFRG